MSIQKKEISQEENVMPARVKTVVVISELHPRCRALGIEDKNKCEYYLEEILITNECRSLGLISQEECKEYMFKKHSQAVCAEAGIINIQIMSNAKAETIGCAGKLCVRTI